MTSGEADALAIRIVDRFRSLPVVWRDGIGAGLFAIGLCFGLWDDGATQGLSSGACAALYSGTVDCETHPGDGFTVRMRLTPEVDSARQAAV